MAYVKGCEWDVFVSYCDENNKVPNFHGAKAGWVDNFVANLKDALEERPFSANPHFSAGQEDILPRKIYRPEKELLPGDSPGHELKAGMEKSAVLILILSQKYLESNWCVREGSELSLNRSLFPRAFTENLKSRTLHKGFPDRIFIVEYENVPKEKWPRELRYIHPTTAMWDDDKTLGKPIPMPDDTAYFQNIDKLGKRMEKRLMALNKWAEKGWSPEDSEMNATLKAIHKGVPVEDARIRILIDSGEEERNLKRLVKITAMRASVGFYFLERGPKTAEEIRMDFLNKASICGGFLIIHDYDDRDTINAKLNEYTKVISSRTYPPCRKGKGFIYVPDKPTPNEMLSDIWFIEHKSLEETEKELKAFFESYKEELETYKEELRQTICT